MTQATKKKHVARELNDYYYTPDDGQDIVKVIRGCGNNLHEVVTATGDQYLVSMPTKFRRSVWIKRGDYLIVSPIEEGNKVRAEIHSILLKDHIRYLKQQDEWPFREEQPNKEEEEDQDEQDDLLLVPNTNRIDMPEQEVEDEGTSESEEEEEEQESESDCNNK